MNLAYTQNIPFATHSPSSDQPIMLQNNNSNFSLWLVDHHGFNDNLGGYHTVIHQDPTPSSIDPPAIVGIGQTYVKLVNNDTQLFFITGGGTVNKLTGNSASATGFQNIGGTILKWGNVAFSSANPILFPTGVGIPVFTNCWVVLLTPIFNSFAPSGKQLLGIKSISATGFNASGSTDGSQITSYYYLAIGS